jgi:collagen type III alpha
MASVSDRPADPLAVRPWDKHATEGSKSDEYLARRFAAASADFKGMALVTFLLATGVAAAVWIIAGVMLEHWIVPGGLPAWARWAWLAVALVATVAAVIRWLVPLAIYRVNVVYAARAIERDHPELHNDLVNAVLVKERGEESAEAVVKSLRRRAAKRLSKLPDEGVVDRSLAVRLGWLLTALVGLACLYQVLAPKSLLTSAARLVAPWSGIAAPSRVRIEPPKLAWRQPGEDPAAVGDTGRAIDIVRGVAELVRGRQLILATEIDGLAGDEKPELLVTPLREDGFPDAAAAAWRMPLKVAGGSRRTAVVPGDGRGLDQPVDLVIAAGDARSERIRVMLVDAPAVLVREIRYEYPSYMNREPETLPGQGDIRGVEGTKVTIVAAANRPLATAAIDLGCDGRPDVSLSVRRPDATVGSGMFTLKLNADRSGADVASYRFMYRPQATSAGRQEADVVGRLEHRIEVIPDLAPEVVIEVPREKVLRVPPDAPVTVRVRAVDPDFGLASICVETRLAGGAARRGAELLAGGPRKSVRVAETLIPSALGATPGSTLEYRAVVADTRPNEPNEVASEWQALQIDASAPQQEQPPQPQDQPQDGGQPAPNAAVEQEGEQEDRDRQQQDGGRQDSKQQDGKQQSREGERQEGQAQESERKQGQQPDPQAAGEEKGEQRGDGQQPADQKGRQQGGQGRGDGKSQDAGSQQGGQQGDQSGDGRDGERQRGEGQGRQDGQKQSGGQQGGEGSEQRPQQQGQGSQQGEQDQAGGEQAGGEQAGGEQARPGEQGQRQDGSQGRDRPDPAVAADGTNDGEAIERILENRRRGEAGGEGESGDEGRPQGQGQSGEKSPERGEPSAQSGQEQAGERQQGEGQQGEGRQGEGQQGEGQQGEGQQGEGQQGEGQQGEGQQGEGQQGEGRQGEGRQGEGQQGEGQQGEGRQGEGRQGEGQQGEGQQGEGRQGEGQQGEGQQGEGRQGEGQQGEGRQGEGRQGEGQQGEGQQGEGRQGEGQQGEGQQGEGQQGEGQQGEGRQGEGRQGEGQQGEGQQGEGRQGEGQQGEGQQGEGQQGEGQQGEGQQGEGRQGEAVNAGDGQAGGGGAAGGPVGQGEAGDAPAGRRDMEWGRQNLEHARNAADLAVEHLRNSLDAGRTDVLDELGWTPEQARAFLDRWRAMQRLAGSDDPRERAEFERAVRSLGLRPDGVRSSRDVPADEKGGQAEGRRSRPPSDYREQFKAFMQGTSGP